MNPEKRQFIVQVFTFTVLCLFFTTLALFALAAGEYLIGALCFFIMGQQAVITFVWEKYTLKKKDNRFLMNELFIYLKDTERRIRRCEGSIR